MKSLCPELEWVSTIETVNLVFVCVYICAVHVIAGVCVCVCSRLSVFMFVIFIYFVGEDSIDVCNVPGEVTFDKSTSTYQNYFGYLDFHTNCSSVLDVQMLNYDPDYPYTYLSKCRGWTLCVRYVCVCVCVWCLCVRVCTYIW
jgi:hypothetical protein